MIRDNIRYRFLKDHLGSVLAVVNSLNGAIAQQITYDEFGQVLSDSNPGFQPFGFAGGMYDPDTKLVRFGAREYNGAIGRWMSKDPILFNGGDTNLYGYVMQDPVNYFDPVGLWTVSSGYLTCTLFSTGMIGATGYIAGNLPGSIIGGVVGFAGGLALCPNPQPPAPPPPQQPPPGPWGGGNNQPVPPTSGGVCKND